MVTRNGVEHVRFQPNIMMILCTSLFKMVGFMKDMLSDVCRLLEMLKPLSFVLKLVFFVTKHSYLQFVPSD